MAGMGICDVMGAQRGNMHRRRERVKKQERSQVVVAAWVRLLSQKPGMWAVAVAVAARGERVRREGAGDGDGGNDDDERFLPSILSQGHWGRCRLM